MKPRMWASTRGIVVFLYLSIFLWDVTMAASVFHSNNDPVQDKHGGIPMGVSDDQCDNGEKNIILDLDISYDDFMCTTQRWTSNKKNIILDLDISYDDFMCTTQRWTSNKETHTGRPIESYCTQNLDNPTHVCMNQTITYDDVIPLSGAHRPLWAKYGEYSYLPKQRWLHNMEHGAAVLLYHPCADSVELDRIKGIIRGCMRKHIITPFKELTREKPFAVLTYGCKLELPYVDAAKIRAFLRAHGNTAPEHRVSEDGQYDFLIMRHATTVSSKNDCLICPEEPFTRCPRNRLP